MFQMFTVIGHIGVRYTLRPYRNGSCAAQDPSNTWDRVRGPPLHSMGTLATVRRVTGGRGAEKLLSVWCVIVLDWKYINPQGGGITHMLHRTFLNTFLLILALSASFALARRCDDPDNPWKIDCIDNICRAA